MQMTLFPNQQKKADENGETSALRQRNGELPNQGKKKGDVAKELYNQNFRARFTKLCNGIVKQSSNISRSAALDSFSSMEDVDFVFIVEKDKSVGYSTKLANWFAKMRHREPITEERMAEAREGYLKGLVEMYKVKYEVVKTPNRDYYLMQLSFYHLGLMMELLGYQWQLRTPDPDKKAFKTFFFVKRNAERFLEYNLNEGSRSSFPSRWRYDLTYYFLVGAIVQMPIYNVWRNALKQPLEEQKKALAEVSDAENGVTFPVRRDKGYSLTRLLADGIFDDWMVPHSQVHKVTMDDVNIAVDTLRKRKGCDACCATCCFPCMTCQCDEAKRHELRKDCPPKKGCSIGAAFCSVWRSFWYGNMVASADIEPKTFEDGREENAREYFGRTGTLRNAFHLRKVEPVSEEKSAKFYHILPLNKLNDYFGEKIGFYFGWIELFLITLVFPAVFGVLLFVGGVLYYTWEVVVAREDEDIDNRAAYILAKACDNYTTPIFAAVTIIWGTTFYELWNRRQRWYAFLWRVENLQKTELERPPVYSFKFAAYLRRTSVGSALMYLPSAFVTLFFICLVIASVYFINVVNVLSIPYCPKPRSMINMTMSSSTTEATSGRSELMDTVICGLFAGGQVLANSVSMFILDALYTNVCYRLTDFEGHSTQSIYTDALVFKLFVFRFFNYYTVLFYIAFGIATKSVKYPAEITGGQNYDYEAYGCGQQPCMAFLSRQLLSVIVTQPFLNSLQDVVLPTLKAIYFSVKEATSRKKISPTKSDTVVAKSPLSDELESQYKLMELSTLNRKEFTAEEYTDKLIVYGALVMFSVALPPAPALALLILRIDLTLDLGRIMTRFRRPLPLRAHDIGMWANAINFLTYAGIITNPLIVVLTSSWGSSFDIWWKFVIFLVVEHVVFAVRMLITFIVPDIPKSLITQQQLHKMIKDEVQTSNRPTTAYVPSRSTVDH